MLTTLAQWISSYQLPTGRRELAQAAVAKVAEQNSWPELAAHCLSAVTHERTFRDLARTYASQKKQPFNPKLSALDPKIDSLVGAIFRTCKEAAANLADDPEGPMATTVLETAFPGGATAIVHSVYPEQFTAVASLLRLFDSQLAAEVAGLGLGAFVGRLEKLNKEFGKYLPATKKEGVVSTDQVRAANAQGQELILQTIAMVLGRYFGSGETVARARTALLAPIELQNEQVKAYLRARRSVPDVDPATGEVIEEPVAEPSPGEPEPDPWSGIS